MIYKVGLNGASGKMGLEIAALLAEGFTFGGDFLELSDAVSLNKSLSHIEGVPVRTWDESPIESVHIWIDFSHPDATLKMLEKTSVPAIIGTTGFSTDQIGQIQEAASKRSLLLCANTSPGMSLMRKFLQHSPPLEWGFVPSVVEAHHEKKIDAPSGSAKELVSLLKQAGYPNTPVHSIRAGGIIGEHEVRFVAASEEIQIIHRVFDRKVFARGALLAANKLLKAKKPGLYQWEDLFQ